MESHLEVEWEDITLYLMLSRKVDIEDIYLHLVPRATSVGCTYMYLTTMYKTGRSRGLSRQAAKLEALWGLPRRDFQREEEATRLDLLFLLLCCWICVMDETAQHQHHQILLASYPQDCQHMQPWLAVVSLPGETRCHHRILLCT